MFRDVFNLEFPEGIDKLKIGDYIFKKVDTYDEIIGKLQQLGAKSQTGSHQVTAIVEGPENEKPAALCWGDPDPKQLLDVMLLLTLFTRRNVFYRHWEGEIAIFANHGIHEWGGNLYLSLPREWLWKDSRTGKLDKTPDDIPWNHAKHVEVGFEKSINNVLATVSSPEWLKRYSGKDHTGGYYLLLFKYVLHRQLIEIAFTSCWTIWEHLFAVHHLNKMSDKAIEGTAGYKKIEFIHKTYFGVEPSSKRALAELCLIRNRIVHYGMRKTNDDNTCMIKFIRRTEQLIALTLNLTPSGTFDGRF
jgi:hypothetical protein